MWIPCIYQGVYVLSCTPCIYPSRPGQCAKFIASMPNDRFSNVATKSWINVHMYKTLSATTGSLVYPMLRLMFQVSGALFDGEVLLYVCIVIMFTVNNRLKTLLLLSEKII